MNKKIETGFYILQLFFKNMLEYGEPKN